MPSIGKGAQDSSLNDQSFGSVVFNIFNFCTKAPARHLGLNMTVRVVNHTRIRGRWDAGLDL